MQPATATISCGGGAGEANGARAAELAALEVAEEVEASASAAAVECGGGTTTSATAADVASAAIQMRTRQQQKYGSIAAKIKSRSRREEDKCEGAYILARRRESDGADVLQGPDPVVLNYL